MKPFLDEDFLLTNETAKTLYHEYAEKMPIIDYHCHINPAEIANNRKFENITQAFLGGDHFGDHYKWRMIRAVGTDEDLITGNADDRDRFQAFAEALPRAIGNPLYHWTHLELKRYFGYNGVLNGQTAEEVWNLCNEKLKSDELSVRGIIKRSQVRLIATTDDPADSLEWHQKLKEDSSFETKVIPAWRPDKALNLEKPEFSDYIAKLSQVSGVKIDGMQALYTALSKRIDFFDKMGCRNCDHGLDYVMFCPASAEEVETIFQKGMRNEPLSVCEIEKYKTALMLFLGRNYAKYHWVMQIHYGAVRNTNTPMYRLLGADTGYDAVSGRDCSETLIRFLDELNKTDELPKTILYSLNPNDNILLDAAAGCFQKKGVCGRVQHGAAWWYNDTKTGMIDHMINYANTNVFGNYLGMLTDSRSFLSYTRHEYFRRILCNLIGTWVENGEYPYDKEALGKLVQDISYNNTKNYFGFDC